MFVVCTVLLVIYKINKRMTLQIADGLGGAAAGGWQRHSYLT